MYRVARDSLPVIVVITPARAYVRGRLVSSWDALWASAVTNRPEWLSRQLQAPQQRIAERAPAHRFDGGEERIADAE